MKNMIDAAREALEQADNKPDELQEAITKLESRYMQARQNTMIKFPIRWALYQTWRDFCGYSTATRNTGRNGVAGRTSRQTNIGRR